MHVVSLCGVDKSPRDSLIIFNHANELSTKYFQRFNLFVE